MSISKRLSPSCQQVVREELDGLPSTAKVTVRSCLADPDLSPVVLAHKCNDCVLTPSGLYSDMVLTVASHIHRAYEPNTEVPGINVSDLQVHKPLIVKEPTNLASLFIEMEVKASSKDPKISSTTLHCTFHSTTPTGTRLQEMGHCTATYESSSKWLQTWFPYTPIILNRISSLQTAAIKENNLSVQLVQRTKAYKLFSSFVQYGPKYQNMSEVIFDTRILEATATIDLVHLDFQKDFLGPYLLDATGHLSGFVCNAVEKDGDKFAYINGGVGAMKLSSKFQPEKVKVGQSTLQNYVQMRILPSDKTVLQGDVFVLQDEEIVGVWEQVRFKRIPRRVLDVFLPKPKAAGKK
ncbi:Conidial yellow pigment biosynthesis polyketide synthase [Cercospora beticola]|uniref:Conidial yellow pigment biosynthesis polyketide synthase n=1 Tax=Cercospora beticola TaxID=122368 RepID=A0A2G5H9Y9_CERBT|nr:Conidial yellow pigment biosynthesis polyketide synthase [Cercospora beticola]PIA89349.1 Conidial yellow pigment biosynthesis polyketide synthase [Cercospora beticola]WPB02799.1 hypothetical protein RHO25_007435 [Cercospora beticola]